MNELVIVALCLCLMGVIMGGALVYLMFELRFGKLKRKVKKIADRHKEGQGTTDGNC